MTHFDKEPWRVDGNTYAVVFKGLRHPQMSRTRLLAEHPRTAAARAKLMDEVDAESAAYRDALAEHKQIVVEAIQRGEIVPDYVRAEVDE